MHVILDELRKYLYTLDELLGGVYVILCNYSCQPVGGGIGQCPATEVTYLGLNQPPVFSSIYTHSSSLQSLDWTCELDWWMDYFMLKNHFCAL